ncbi:MAG TPA: GNAT family N-acetyltransferase [Leptolyngbya sp.]|jgi:GNAT superfamily N-acetyltransferase|nr:GNAT family N-acetyltransferase [Leptolyngbya sp.]
MLIQLAESDSQILKCFSTLSQLRPQLQQETFLDQVRRQQQGGYRLAFIDEEAQVIAVAGFRISERLACGRFMYVDDLIVDQTMRSQQYGQHLFDWLIHYATQHQCKALDLDSGVQRFEAHRFYLRQRMSISSHHFRLNLL